MKYPTTFSGNCQRPRAKIWKILSGFVHIGEAGGKNHCGLWQIRDMMLDKDSPADRAETRGGEAMQTAELAALVPTVMSYVWYHRREP